MVLSQGWSTMSTRTSQPAVRASKTHRRSKPGEHVECTREQRYLAYMTSGPDHKIFFYNWEGDLVRAGGGLIQNQL